jgi:hypothetical protein
MGPEHLHSLGLGRIKAHLLAKEKVQLADFILNLQSVQSTAQCTTTTHH